MHKKYSEIFLEFPLKLYESAKTTFCHYFLARTVFTTTSIPLTMDQAPTVIDCITHSRPHQRYDGLSLRISEIGSSGHFLSNALIDHTIFVPYKFRATDPSNFNHLPTNNVFLLYPQELLFFQSHRFGILSFHCCCLAWKFFIISQSYYFNSGKRAQPCYLSCCKED